MSTDEHEGRTRRVSVSLGGNKTALALGALAVVIASTGTAVAVTLTKTTIVDPKSPSRVARVDSTGHLSVAGAVTGKVAVTGPVTVTVPKATLSVSRNFSTPSAGYSNILIQPTTATVALTRFAVGNPASNASASNANYVVLLVQQNGNTAAECVGSGVRILGEYSLAPGDRFESQYTAPVVVKPDAGKKYCVSAYGYTERGTADTGGYFAFGTLDAYVVSGTATTTATQAGVRAVRKTVR